MNWTIIPPSTVTAHTLVMCFVDYLLLMFVHPLRHYPPHVDTHYACATSHAHTHHPPLFPYPTPQLPFTVAESPEGALCLWWCCGESCGLQWLQQETHCLHCGREWCEVRRSNRSTVHCTRVWYGAWVVWCGLTLLRATLHPLPLGAPLSN